jgi:hypothetical protein
MAFRIAEPSLPSRKRACGPSANVSPLIAECFNWVAVVANTPRLLKPSPPTAEGDLVPSDEAPIRGRRRVLQRNERREDSAPNLKNPNAALWPWQKREREIDEIIGGAVSRRNADATKAAERRRELAERMRASASQQRRRLARLSQGQNHHDVSSFTVPQIHKSCKSIEPQTSRSSLRDEFARLDVLLTKLSSR